MRLEAGIIEEKSKKQKEYNGSPPTIVPTGGVPGPSQTQKRIEQSSIFNSPSELEQSLRFSFLNSRLGAGAAHRLWATRRQTTCNVWST